MCARRKRTTGRRKTTKPDQNATVATNAERTALGMRSRAREDRRTGMVSCSGGHVSGVLERNEEPGGPHRRVVIKDDLRASSTT